MSIQGSYRINFTDPKNGSFVIEPYTVNGNVTPTSDVLHAKATRANTSLQLPGQYVPNYGELVHENLVHLLENFAGDTPPTDMIEGQLWYDTGDSYSIVDISIAGVTVSGNHSAAFGGYITTGAILTAWYGPKSVIDNSYNSIDFKVTTVMVTVDNNTVITIVGVDGTDTTLPNTTVGGFITPSQESRLGRLKVATKINTQLTWTDVVTVNCGLLPPVTEHLQNGDLWFDVGNMLLKLYLNNSWFTVTGNYLPLQGGTLTGPLQMDANPVFFSGLVSTGDTLTNKLYVDAAIVSAIAPLEEELTTAITDLNDRVSVVETVLPNKVSKTGDNISGALVFGPNGTQTPLQFGIDMANAPIVNPSITWSSADYLNAVGETHNVVDKNYVALSLKQHLLDATHAKPFIVEQPDGTGLIVNDIFFDDVAHDLSWKANNTVYGIGITSTSMVISTGEWVGSSVEFRQTGKTGDPLLSVSDSGTRSYGSVYLFDGQPQPTYHGNTVAENEDTKAATKGYVLDAIGTSTAVNSPIVSATFSYDEALGPYNLTLVRATGDSIIVDVNHTHMSSRIDHTYQPLTNWSAGKADLVGNSIGNVDTTTVEVMLNALNEYKAPTRGAIFADAPAVGIESYVTALSDSPSGFSLGGTTTDLLSVGELVTIQYPDVVFDPDLGENVPTTISATYTITGTTVVLTDTFFNVSPSLPSPHDLVAKPMTCLIPTMYAGGDVRSLLNYASIDQLITQRLQNLILDGGTY